ncbi:ABC transporter substrate-binding protein [Sulfitobacter sp.]|uniref:ABC transporter substrate-binding protein n=1 Tax=Sulfitobacter sp. TaxID=1903071 RepID=UPI003002D8BC
MTILTRRQTLGGIAASAAALGLAAPAIAQGRKIVLGALSFTSHAGTFVAVEREYFKQAGMDVELKFFQAAQPMAVAIASGDVDYAVTAISGGLVSLADKGAIKVIGGALQEEAGIDGQKFLVSGAAFKSGITAPGMLDGKSYGISTAGSSFHYMGAKMAAAEGISLQFKPLQKVGAIIGALKSGQIDAWSIVPHIAKPLAGSGAVHIVGDVATYLPDYQVTTLFTSAKNARDEKQMTQDYVAAYSKGVADYNAAMIARDGGDGDVNAMVDLLHKYVYTDRPREKAAPSIINGTMRLNEGGKMNVASVRDQLEWFQSEDLVGKDISLDALIDTSYVETVGA